MRKRWGRTTLGPPGASVTWLWYISKQGRHAEAEPLYQRALAICEKGLGPDHPNTATVLNNLAALYHDQDRCAEAEPLYRRGLALREKALGAKHPDTIAASSNYAALLRKMGRDAEAAALQARFGVQSQAAKE